MLLVTVRIKLLCSHTCTLCVFSPCAGMVFSQLWRFFSSLYPAVEVIQLECQSIYIRTFWCLMQAKIKHYLVIVDAPFHEHKRCYRGEKSFACNFLEVPVDPVVSEGLLPYFLSTYDADYICPFSVHV